MKDISPLAQELADDIVEAAIEYKNEVQHGQFGAVTPTRKRLWDLIDDYESEVSQ